MTPIDEPTFRRMRDWFANALAEDAGFRRVQMSWLVRGLLLEDEPSACLFQFGELRRTGSDGNPIIWLDHRQRGGVLYGLDPQAFLPEITSEILHRALVREVGYLREEMISKRESEWRDQPFYRAYAVLTLCRILYSHATGTVTAKRAAAAWVRAQGVEAPAIDALIEHAAQWDDARGSAGLPVSSIREFIRSVERALLG